MQTAYSLVIVEDDPDLTRLLELRLDRDDRLVHSRSFETAIDALAGVRDDCPDVIICDVGLPMMSGLEALPGLRAACPDAVIVMYTAAPDSARHAPALGADAVVSKEYGPSRLFDHVVELLRRGS